MDPSPAPSRTPVNEEDEWEVAKRFSVKTLTRKQWNSEFKFFFSLPIGFYWYTDTDGFVVPSLGFEDPDHNETLPAPAETAKLSSQKIPKKEDTIYLGPHEDPPSQQNQIESIPTGRKQKLKHRLKEADKKSSGTGRENKIENLRELVGVGTQNSSSNLPKSSTRDWLDPHCHESEFERRSSQ